MDGERVITQWGMLDGKFQQTIDIPGPNGKPGTSAYNDAKQAARNKVMREVTIKAKRGYKLMNELSGEVAKPLAHDLEQVQQGTSIDFKGPLPHNVSFSKPVNSISRERLKKLSLEEGEVVDGMALAWTVKLNGMCHIVSKDSGGNVWIQKRGKMEIENDKYPHLIEEFSDFLPPKSIVLCEFYMPPGKGMEDFKKMQQIANSLPERALSLQKQLGLVQSCVFRIPFWRSMNMEESTYNFVWLDFLDDLVDGWGRETCPNLGTWGEAQTGLCKLEHVHGPIQLELTLEEAYQAISEDGYEGFVVYIREEQLGPKHVSFLGNPDRPSCCFKVKAALEDDFIAMWNPDGRGMHCTPSCRNKSAVDVVKQRTAGKCFSCGKDLKPSGTYGTGKNREVVGSLSLFQIDADGVLQYICEVGTGLSDEDRRDIAEEEDFSCVVQVGYQARSYISRKQDSNALTHPKVLQFRFDKKPEECVNKDL